MRSSHPLVKPLFIHDSVLDNGLQFFWGCLEKGIYLAPSPYETGFLSLAHTEADLDETLGVFDEVLAKI